MTMGFFKRGWKTSEFWVSLLTTVGTVTAAAAGIVPGKVAVAAAAVSSAAYAIARGVAKIGKGEGSGD